MASLPMYIIGIFTLLFVVPMASCVFYEVIISLVPRKKNR